MVEMWRYCHKRAVRLAPGGSGGAQARMVWGEVHRLHEWTPFHHRGSPESREIFGLAGGGMGGAGRTESAVPRHLGLLAAGVAGHARAMRYPVFLSGAAILAMGVVATRLMGREEAMAFLFGALTLGGGLIICGLFSLKMRWHGLIGAGVLALLGAARGLANLPEWLKLAAGGGMRGPAPALELGVTLLCVSLLLRVVGTLRRERARRM